MCQTCAYFFIRSVRSLASEMPSTCAVRFCDFLSWSLIVMYSTDWAMWMPTRLVCAGCAIFSHFSFCSISLTLLLPPSLLTHTYTFPRTHLSQMLIYVHILSLSFSIIKDLAAVEQKIVYQPNLAAAMAELLMGKATNTRIHTLMKKFVYAHIGSTPVLQSLCTADPILWVGGCITGSSSGEQTGMLMEILGA